MQGKVSEMDMKIEDLKQVMRVGMVYIGVTNSRGKGKLEMHPDHSVDVWKFEADRPIRLKYVTQFGSRIVIEEGAIASGLRSLRIKKCSKEGGRLIVQVEEWPVPELET